MSIKITETKDNVLFDRKEVTALIDFDAATPKRKELKDAVAQKVGANPDLTILREVKEEFGMKRVKVVAHLYESKEVLMKTEPHFILVREGLAEKKKKEKTKDVKKESKPHN